MLARGGSREIDGVLGGYKVGLDPRLMKWVKGVNVLARTDLGRET